MDIDEEIVPNTNIPEEKKILRSSFLAKRPMLIIGFLLLLLLITSVGSYAFVNWKLTKKINLSNNRGNIPPISVEHTNWKTYADQWHGFSFKYPPSYVFNDYESGYTFDPELIGEDNHIMFALQKSLSDADRKNLLYLSKMVKVEKELSLMEAFEKYQSIPFPKDRYTYEKILLDGNEALHITSTDQNLVMVYFKNGEYLYYIFPLKKELQEEFEDILSSFKFLDKNADINTNDWQTYNNSEFTFKYPPGISVGNNAAGETYVESDKYDIEIKISKSGTNNKCSTYSYGITEKSNSTQLIFDNTTFNTNETSYVDGDKGGVLPSYIHVAHKGYDFCIYQDAKDPRRRQINEKILSTFKFNNQP